MLEIQTPAALTTGHGDVRTHGPERRRVRRLRHLFIDFFPQERRGNPRACRVTHSTASAYPVLIGCELVDSYLFIFIHDLFIFHLVLEVAPAGDYVHHPVFEKPTTTATIL